MTRTRADDLIVFVGPSLAAEKVSRLCRCRVLPPARSGDLLAVLSGRPLAIALIDGFFECVPSVWHHEILEALDAGVAVFGGGSLGALRAAELDRYGMVGVGRIYRWVKAGIVEDDAEVALLHGPGEFLHAPISLPLVSVRAIAEDAQAAGILTRSEARAIVKAAQAFHFTERVWSLVLSNSTVPRNTLVRFRTYLEKAPDPKEEDARATVTAAAAYVRSRRAGSPAPPRPSFPRPSSYLRRAKLARATAIIPGKKPVTSATVLARLRRRADAGRLAADGLRRAILTGIARSFGLTVSTSEAESALKSWLHAAGVRNASREEFLGACGLDEADARRLGEDLALEARVLSSAHSFVPDGPAAEEGLALSARLCGAWIEEAVRASDDRRNASEKATRPRTP